MPSTERTRYRESTTTEKGGQDIKKNPEKNIGALVEDILQNSHADTIIKSIEEKNLEEMLLVKHGLKEKETNYQVEFPELEDNYYYIDDEEYL
jgi:hypothetical protein